MTQTFNFGAQVAVALFLFDQGFMLRVPLQSGRFPDDTTDLLGDVGVGVVDQRRGAPGVTQTTQGRYSKAFRTPQMQKTRPDWRLNRVKIYVLYCS